MRLYFFIKLEKVKFATFYSLFESINIMGSERLILTLYLYAKSNILVSRENCDYSEENLDKCFDRQVEWENLDRKNTSLLRREKHITSLHI